MPRIACVVNPASRDGKSGKIWPSIEKKLVEAGFDVETHLTEYVGHASEISHTLRNRDDLDLVVAVGGDGSVHEVASGLRNSEMRIGIIPMGTGNDVARAHNIPLRNRTGQIEILKSGTDRHVGAIRLEGKPAPAVSSYPSPKSNGWDGDSHVDGNVVRWVFLESDGGVTSATSRAKLSRGKWIKGSAKYTYLGLTEIISWKRKRAWIKIDDEPGEVVDFNLFAFVMSEMFGGGYKVAPNASPLNDHGHLVIATKLSKFQMVRLMGPLRKGKHVGKWGIYMRNAKRFEIRSVDEDGNPSDLSHNPPIWVQADGEPCITTPAILEFHPKQLWIRGSNKVKWDN